MTNYLVRWVIELDATDPIDAARKALEIQHDPRSTATVFHVRDWPAKDSMRSTKVDLEKEGRHR